MDFDSDEALIAIVSVCAFALLLTNQIGSRIASVEAQSRATVGPAIKKRASLRSLSDRIAEICLRYTAESEGVGWFEYDCGIAEVLQTSGFDATHSDDLSDGLSDEYWGEVIVKKGRSWLSIDTRVARDIDENGVAIDLKILIKELLGERCVGGIMILRQTGAINYSIYKGLSNSKPVFIIKSDDEDDEQMEILSADLTDIRKV